MLHPSTLSDNTYLISYVPHVRGPVSLHFSVSKHISIL